MYNNPIQICWEITYKCNFECIYCLNNSGHQKQQELEGKDVLDVAKEIASCKPLDVIISGGEPFLKKELKDALKILKEAGAQITILTNGVLLTPQILKEFSGLVDLIQISLDTMDEKVQNELLNIKDGYKRIHQGIKNVLATKTKLVIGTVATKQNYRHLPKVLDFCIELGINHLSLSSVMPQGRAKANHGKLALNKEEHIELIKLLMPYSHKIKILGHEPGLAFLIGGKAQYICDGGKTSCAISADGWVMPCAYIRQKVGSLKTKSLTDIWQQDMFYVAAKLSCAPTDKGLCSTCSKVNDCRGGCKGITYSYYGKVDVSNPICVYDQIKNLKVEEIL